MRLIRTANAEELDAMRVAYVDVMGEMFDGGALPEEDFWNLVRLGDNVFARRRIADHHLAEGDVFEAGSELLCAAERGDRESIRRLVTGREFVSHVDTSLNVAALLNLVFLDDSGLAEFVEGLGREDPVAADNILMWSWTWNRDPERYSEWVCTCLANGSARARFTEAWNLLRPGFTGGSVDRLDEALELMSDAAGTFWRASMHMAILHYVGRYVERDEDVARMYVENACGLADDDVSEMWRRFLVGDGSEESDLPMEPPFELDDIPEWTVLQDMTYTWGHQTLFSVAVTPSEDSRTRSSPATPTDGSDRTARGLPSSSTSRMAWRCPSIPCGRSRRSTILFRGAGSGPFSASALTVPGTQFADSDCDGRDGSVSGRTDYDPLASLQIQPSLCTQYRSFWEN